MHGAAWCRALDAVGRHPSCHNRPQSEHARKLGIRESDAVDGYCCATCGRAHGGPDLDLAYANK